MVAVAQWLERLPVKQDVAGSNPASHPMPKIINYEVISPSGNPTAILYGKYSSGEKNIINQKIFNSDKEVEQIGYIYSKNNSYKFEMMGNEFSGNGCRTAAYSLLKKKSGKISFVASGIDEKIFARVSKNSLCGITLPYKFINKKIRKVKNGFLIKIFGSFILILEENGNYKKAKKIIEKRFKRNRAVGIMFIRKMTKNKIKLNPYFYVKSTDTLKNETACGSGSIATALYLHSTTPLKKFEILQPSGKTISVRFIPKERKFTILNISGPTTFLGNKTIKI